MPERLTDFPLFPLGMVALPTEMVPLHIFEERYKTMIGECLTRDSSSGSYGCRTPSWRRWAARAKSCEVLSRMDDGRLNIMSRGTQALAVLRRQDESAYPAGEIELLDDDEEAPDSEARQQATDAYAALVEQATDERPDDEALAQLSAYEMAARVDFEARRQAGAADPALGERAPAPAGHPARARYRVAWRRRSAPRCAPSPTARFASAERRPVGAAVQRRSPHTSRATRA